MKKSLLLLFYLLLFFKIGFTQTSSDNIHVKENADAKGFLSGKVTDAKTGEPLPGATIYIHELKTGAIANNAGIYQTPSISDGRYTIEVSYQGYATDVEVLTVSGATSKDFQLAQTYVEQQSVTVTGVVSATSTKRSTQPVTVIKHDDLNRVVSTNVIDALSKTVPGVSMISTGPAIAKPVIRGLSYNRVVVVNDGIRQEGQQWGDEHGIEVDDYSVQRIEVLKGPASMLYGSDALAGVINIQTQVPAPEGSIKANIQSEYQTNNSLRGFNASIGGTKNGFSWNAYGSYKGAEAYSNKYDGRVFNSNFYNKDFGGMLGYRGVWGHSYLLMSNFDQHLGIIEGERDSATGLFIKQLPYNEETIATSKDYNGIKPEIPYQHIQHFKLASENTFNINRNRLDLNLGFQRNQRREFGDPDYADIANARFDLKTFNYSAAFYFPYVHNFKTSIGVSGMYQNNQNKAEETLIPNYDLFDAGAFVITQYLKNKLTASAGLRVDNRHLVSHQMLEDDRVKFPAFTKNFSNFSASAGFSYQATDAITLKLNIAKAFRAPNMAELASNGAHEGTSRYEIGSQNLKSENSYQADAGFEANTQHISFTANIFYNSINDFIFYQRVLNNAGQDSIIADPETGNPLQVYRFNQQNAHLYGGELNLDIHPHPLDWLHFENTFSYTRGEFQDAIDGSKNIPFIPAARWISEIRTTFLKKGKSLRNLYFRLESDYTFKQNHPFTGYNTETATPCYLLVDAGIGADVVSKGKTIFNINITGFNLGNVAYQNHLSRLKYLAVNNATGREGVYEMGRNFSIKLNVPFNFHI